MTKTALSHSHVLSECTLTRFKQLAFTIRNKKPFDSGKQPLRLDANYTARPARRTSRLSQAK